MRNVDLSELFTPIEVDLDSNARLLQSKFNDCSPKEQFKFFRNVVEHELELHGLKEVHEELKGASL